MAKFESCKFSKDQNCTALLIYVSLTTSAELIIFTIPCKATRVSVIQVCIPRNESCQFLLLPSKSFTNSLCISRKLYKTKNSTFTRTQCTIAGCMVSSRSTFFWHCTIQNLNFFCLILRCWPLWDWRSTAKIPIFILLFPMLYNWTPVPSW